MISLLKNVVFSLFAFFLIISLTKNVLDYQKKMQFYKVYQSDLLKAKAQNNDLKSEIARSKDMTTREENIRNKLNLLKNNEIALILPISPTPTPPPYVEKEPYKQWLSLFLHH